MPAARSQTATLLVLLAVYVFTRALLGAVINPPYNGPDEGGHVEYVRTLVETQGRQITGVEARQPPLYYTGAAAVWIATTDHDERIRLLAMRALTALAGIATLACTWRSARLIWPQRPFLAAATGIATLAPGHLFLLSSVSNDPLAAALSSGVVLAAVRLTQAHRPLLRAWLGWALLCLAALATKLTAAPVVLASAGALAYRYRHCFIRQIWFRVLAGLGIVTTLGSYLVLLGRHPSSSPAASMAHFWPQVALGGPLTYVTSGGVVESLRTYWYAYDYLVRWPAALDAALLSLTSLLLILAGAGLAFSLVRGTLIPETPATSGLPGIIWAVALVQVAAVVARFGFAATLGNEMGGAAQAKSFFTALAPLSILFVAGLAWIIRAAGWRDQALALGLFGWIVALDATSIAIMAWYHYRWWQVGL